MHEELLLLSEENVRELLSVEDAIAAAEETFYLSLIHISEPTRH